MRPWSKIPTRKKVYASTTKVQWSPQVPSHAPADDLAGRRNRMLNFIQIAPTDDVSAIAFSSEVDSGSRKENASKQKVYPR
jgi:hypothetical protein